jgi:hypothetical protein
MKRIVFSMLFVGLTVAAIAQNAEWGAKLTGFVKADYILDSRQTVSSREQQFYFYPAPEKLDNLGNDLNDKPAFNMLAIQSRLTFKISGPDAFGAKTSAMIEGAFFGQTEADINGFRLRHAYLKLNWEHTELLMGQYWNPMFVTQAFPGVVNFNTGVPFQPFARNPQIRLTYKSGNVNVIFAALSQRDFCSVGPIGTCTSYLRNNVLPDLHAQIHFGDENSVYGGLAVAYKSLIPRVSNAFNADVSSEKVSGFTFLGFVKHTSAKYTLKAEAMYGQNASDLCTLGGFAETQISATQEYTYKPINTLSAWIDFETKGNDAFQWGMFAGYTENLGTDGNIGGVIYARGYSADGSTGIASVYRISPRFIWNSGKVRFAFEPDYTVAAYGKTDKENGGKITDTKSTGNLRALFSAYYFF